MSGPKGYSYVVVSPEELARRALFDVLTRCDNLKFKLATTNRVLSARGLQTSPVNKIAANSLGEAELLEADLHSALFTAEQRLKDSMRAEALQAMQQTLAPVLDEQFLKSFENQQLLDDAAVEVGDSQRTEHSVHTQVRKALVQVSRIENASEREPLVTLAADISAVPAGETGGRLSELIARVNEALRRQEHRKLLRDEAEQQLLDFSAADPEAQPLFACAESVTSTAEIAALKRLAAELKTNRTSRENDAFVTQMATEALVEMGYRVEPLEADDTSTESAILARREDLPDHALQVRLLVEHNLLLTRVVALRDTNTRNDIAAEQLTCGDSAKLAARLSQHGVTTNRTHEQPVGAVPVILIGEASTRPGAEASESRRTFAPQKARRRQARDGGAA